MHTESLTNLVNIVTPFHAHGELDESGQHRHLSSTLFMGVRGRTHAVYALVTIFLLPTVLV